MSMKKYTVVELEVESSSKPGQFYKVKQWGDGKRTCRLKANGYPCADHYWRDRDCKHITGKLLPYLKKQGIKHVD